MLNTLYSQVGGAVWIVVCLFAFVVGGRTERIAAVLLIATWLASAALQDVAETTGVYWAVGAIDLGLLVVFAALAWKSEGGWPTWASAIQLVLVLSHVATQIDLRITTRAYVTTLNLASYLVLACLAWGALASLRRRQGPPIGDYS